MFRQVAHLSQAHGAAQLPDALPGSHPLPQGNLSGFPHFSLFIGVTGLGPDESSERLLLVARALEYKFQLCH